jgi:uncharacterized protein
MRLYFDANTIIYAVEQAPPFSIAIASQITAVENSVGGAILTSRLSRLECRVKPVRDGNAALLARFDAFFQHPFVHVMEVTAPVIERATELRARYGFKTPDAIHLATAIEEKADRFLTGDDGLRRCTEIEVEVLRAS